MHKCFMMIFDDASSMVMMVQSHLAIITGNYGYNGHEMVCSISTSTEKRMMISLDPVRTSNNKQMKANYHPTSVGGLFNNFRFH